MISINVVCTGKNSRLEGTRVITDISFQPESVVHPNQTHARGAVIGVPDPNSSNTEPQEQQKPSYNLTSGGISINVTESKEADTYQIGQTYQLAVGALATPAQTESKK